MANAEGSVTFIFMQESLRACVRVVATSYWAALPGHEAVL